MVIVKIVAYIKMIVGRGEVKAFLFDKEIYTIETAKKVLKEEECNYKPTMKQDYIETKKE